MKITILLIIALSVSIVNAAIITVDNNVPSAGDYTTFVDAQLAATDGDIIYFFPSLTNYGSFTVNKRLSIYGVGFDLDVIPGSAYLKTVTVDSITFQEGSEGSIIEGIRCGYININNNNITVKRNEIIRIYINTDYTTDIFILQNRIVGNFGIITTSNHTEAYLSNNIIIHESNTYAVSFRQGSMYGEYNTWMIFNNNFTSEGGIIGPGGNYHTNTVIFENNIIIDGNLNYYPFTEESEFRYNMCNASQLPEGNGNIINVDMSTVFIDFENDNFHLLEGSPALGTGATGFDMGIYGGDATYVDGGIPGLPSIYYLDSDIIGSQLNGLDVMIRARGNN